MVDRGSDESIDGAPTPGDGSESDADYDVVIVGGGPAGCAAGVFTGRYGLDTAIFDRGNSSLRRCAFLENYLGFPAGIDVETFEALIHDHAAEAGCERIEDMVTTVERTDANEPSDPADASHPSRFVVETQDGRQAAASRVVAATRYDGDYLRPLGGDAMFRTIERDGESTEYFDPDYPEEDGRTPIDGLYVASPSADHDRQAVTAAGRGARVARTLIEDRRHDRGYPEPVADYWDWLRRAAELPEDERRDHWRAWFDDRVPDDHGIDEDRLANLRAADVDRLSREYLDPAAVDERTERGNERLLERVGEEQIRAFLDENDE